MTADPDPPRWTVPPAEYDDVALALDGILDEVRVTVPAAVVSSLASSTAASGGGGRDDGATDSATDDAARRIKVADLTDQEGTPVARLTVTERSRTAEGGWKLTGTVTPLAAREDGVFAHLHLPPAVVRERFAGRKVAAVPLDAPLDKAALTALTAATRAYDVTVLLPLVGAGSSRIVSAHALVRATVVAAELLPGETLVVPVPLARREDPAEDTALRTRVAEAYGGCVEFPLTSSAAAGGDYPEPIAAIVAAEHPPPHRQGLVVFFTGLSGSGKSTLARRLRDVILERGDRTVTLLDGDVVRQMLSAGLGFSKADREANVTRIGFVAAEVARHGGLAICAPIAPYADTRARVRQMVAEAGGAFVLVHVATPLAECERRDRKGLYAKARAGLITGFTGISDPYEEPTDADLRLDTSVMSVEEAVGRIVDLLTARGWLRPDSSPAGVARR
ncbi:adenylyl-sulfate kinase [Thermasporomyces composti]|uniref:Adenylyl-sulfate kinase n=1 Tax=Thermasporomyces composti TaxID=696763 RepID=A0A3D9V2N2_THECX|nr:adenylyl-sulfate kinase [Thermasporomyces composti]REF36062.1 sulfate adenylyltransferase [Thermasporomyces composti]